MRDNSYKDTNLDDAPTDLNQLLCTVSILLDNPCASASDTFFRQYGDTMSDKESVKQKIESIQNNFGKLIHK